MNAKLLPVSHILSETLIMCSQLRGKFRDICSQKKNLFGVVFKSENTFFVNNMSRRGRGWPLEIYFKFISGGQTEKM